MIKLTIELVPSTSWYSNVRSQVTPAEWDIIRKQVYKECNHKCVVCGQGGLVHCHEEWEYNDKKRIQTLKRMIALCPDCHQVKHIGLAQIQGKFNNALAHLMKINNWKITKAYDYINKASELWRERSEYEYEIVIDILKQYVPIVRYGKNESHKLSYGDMHDDWGDRE